MMKTKIHAIHMIGIGGSGMSGIAEVLLNQGYRITGSDIADSAMVCHLRSLGADIAVGHRMENIGDAQVVVKSTAISEDNPEVLGARQKKIPVIPRAEMLAELMRLHKGIAVAGTHGKTTTTSLVASIFDAAGMDPTVIIGGRVNGYGSNAHLGHGEYLIAEADESDGSFLCLFPIINVVTNIDNDHLDHYGDRLALEDAFLRFMNNVPFYGLNVVCGDDPGIRKLLAKVKRPVLTYGFGEDNDLRAKVTECDRLNRFEIMNRDAGIGEATLPQPGRHNILNALGAIGASLNAGVSLNKCLEGIRKFRGVGRRFELKGEKMGVTVIDDYGHHPTEISATLRAARDVFPGRRIVAAFQPHRYTRTQAHFGEFCTVFNDADFLLLTDIYPASEKPIPGVTGLNLARGISRSCGTPLRYFNTLDEMRQGLDNIVCPGDVLLTLGAGSITKLGPAWLEGNA